MDELIPRLAKPGSTIANPLGRVLGIARKIDSRDGGTKRHSQVVARYAELTARELGLPEDVVDDIRLAGLLHDVGKSEIPERILAKPGPLSNIEWLEMRRHPWIMAGLTFSTASILALNTLATPPKPRMRSSWRGATL